MIWLFCVLLIMFSIVGESRADPQGLLLLGQPLQEVKLEYELQDTRNSTGRSSTTADLNRYFETYLISLPFAVLKRDYFEGNLTLGGRAD